MNLFFGVQTVDSEIFKGFGDIGALLINGRYIDSKMYHL
jgi:hypothetical protein